MTDDLPFYVFVLIWSSAGRAQTVHIGLDVVIAELANLVKSTCKFWRNKSFSFKMEGELPDSHMDKV